MPEASRLKAQDLRVFALLGPSQNLRGRALVLPTVSAPIGAIAEETEFRRRLLLLARG